MSFRVDLSMHCIRRGALVRRDGRQARRRRQDGHGNVARAGDGSFGRGSGEMQRCL